jgi:hypothetical protein
MLLDFKNEQNPTKPRSSDQLAGPPGGEFGDNSPLKDNLLAATAVLGATYGWVLALLTGVIALIVILFR